MENCTFLQLSVNYFMQEKIIKTSFNRKFFIEGHHAIWAFSNQKLIRPYLIYTSLAILCLTFGLFEEHNRRFPIATIVSGGYLFSMILTWGRFFERRTKYFKKIKAIASRYEQMSMESTFTFSDDGFEYKDVERLIKLNWSLFDSPRIFKDTIMLVLKDSGAVGFTIGRYEVGEQVYLELCDILKGKTGNGELHDAYASSMALLRKRPPIAKGKA